MLNQIQRAITAVAIMGIVFRRLNILFSPMVFDRTSYKSIYKIGVLDFTNYRV